MSDKKPAKPIKLVKRVCPYGRDCYVGMLCSACTDG